MTSAGQCRLSPLIPLIQDSNQLYDFLVRIMFKLHGNLPNDVLQGHRDRFRAIFTQLKSFYGQSRNLQYFVNLITVPKLPESAPNFGSQVDFGSYTAPVVVVPEPEPEPEPELVSNLVDMTEDERPPPMPPRPASSASNGSASASAASEAAAAANLAAAQVLDMKRIVQDRDDLIRHLHVEVDRLAKGARAQAAEARDEQARLDQLVATLNSQLSDAHEQLTNMRFHKEELELKAQSATRQLADDERAKASEEKFQKLKVMYGSIREEHVRLLRQHGDVSKQLAASTRTAADAMRERDEMRQQLDEQQAALCSRDAERLQQSAETEATERAGHAAQVLQLQRDNDALAARLDDVRAHQADELAALRAELAALGAEHTQQSGELVALRERSEREQVAAAEVRQQLAEVQSDRGTVEERLQQSAESAQRERGELAERLAALEAERDELLGKLETLQAEQEASAAELTVVKEQLEQANAVRVVGARLIGESPSSHARTHIAHVSHIISIICRPCPCPSHSPSHSLFGYSPLVCIHSNSNANFLSFLDVCCPHVCQLPNIPNYPATAPVLFLSLLSALTPHARACYTHTSTRTKHARSKRRRPPAAPRTSAPRSSRTCTICCSNRKP